MKVGLEIHVYPRTEAKLFCMCPVRTAEQNKNVCPICTGQPGAKPMAPNARAVDAALALATALGCKMEKPSSVMRKHYFYPDLPSNYQRTSTPVGRSGSFLGVRIREVHFEEDAGRYEPRRGEVDFNRAGVPLIEVVTEPDITSVSQALEFINEFSLLLRYLKLVDPTSVIKADTNVSVADVRVEVKNINTTHGILAAIKYEVERQTELINEGQMIAQETRHFDESKGKTISSREKETEADYRYMEDPDLPPIRLKLKVKLPEDMFTARKRLQRDGLDVETARAVAEEQELLKLYDKLSKKNNKKVAEWIRRDLRGELNYRSVSFADSGLQMKDVEKLVKRLLSEKITSHKARETLRALLDKMPVDSGAGVSQRAIEDAVDAVLVEEKDAVARYRAGKTELFNYLLGKANKKLKLKADPKYIAEVLRKKL